jgi:ketosteroid isomerase-like protein
VSQQNVEVVRGQFEALNRRDTTTLMDAVAANVVLVVDPGVVPTKEGTFCGREAVVDWFADWFRSFARDYRFDIEEARPIGERVFVVARHHGHGRASGVEVEMSVAYAYTVQAGKIVRVEIYANRAHALADLGMEG